MRTRCLNKQDKTPVQMTNPPFALWTSSLTLNYLCGEHLQTHLSANEISARCSPLGSSSPSPRRGKSPLCSAPHKELHVNPGCFSLKEAGETPPTQARHRRRAGPQGEESGDEQTGSRRAPTPRRRADTSENGSLTALPRDSRPPGAVRQPQTRGRGLRHLLLMPRRRAAHGLASRPAPRSQAECSPNPPVL